MQAQWDERKTLFLRAFSKNVLKRQIIIFHLASGDKMSKKLIRFNREGKTVVFKKAQFRSVANQFAGKNGKKNFFLSGRPIAGHH